MAERTAIGWCHHTFNPWWGCVEVSPACDRCYAREFAARVRPGLWGADAPRRFFGDKHWDEPLRWSRRAEQAGERRRVFCASMADILEDRDGAEGARMRDARERLWFTIANTPWLDWLLLSKRPQNYRRFVPAAILAVPNVLPGATVEHSDYAWRARALVELACAGPKWVSYEPVLGPLTVVPGIGWYVVGGESGRTTRRSMDLGWLASFVAQCRASRVPVFVKQDSGRLPGKQGRIADALWVHEVPPAAVLTSTPSSSRTSRTSDTCRSAPS